MSKKRTWYEVFTVNEAGNSVTIYKSFSLEKSVFIYRKSKLVNKHTKIDKWLKHSLLSEPIPVKSILN